MAARSDRLEWWPRANLRPNPNNVRDHDEAQVAAISEAMRDVGWTIPLLVVEDKDKPMHGMIVAGHGRYLAAPDGGFAEDCKVLVAEGWTKRQIDTYALFDNQIALLATWNEADLTRELKRIRGEHGAEAMPSLGFTQDQLNAFLNPAAQVAHRAGSLAEKFGVPPFSVINMRSGWWQKRKAAWLALGINSEAGRAGN